MDGLEVLCPHDADSAARLLRYAASRRGPTVLLESRDLAARRGRVQGQAGPPQLVERRSGAHVTLATWGSGVSRAEAAAEQLALDGIEAQVLVLESLHPLPIDALGDHVRATGRLVVVHPADDVLADLVRLGGLDTAFLYLESPIAAAPAAPAAIVQAARDTVFY